MKKKSLAQVYIRRSSLEPRPRPVRRDQLGRQVFDDGSTLDRNCLGNPIVGEYDPAEWVEKENRAFKLGKADRSGRRRMNPDYVGTGRKFPGRICAAYREGFFSAADWPAKSR